jgi:hypothetical protein
VPPPQVYLFILLFAIVLFGTPPFLKLCESTLQNPSHGPPFIIPFLGTQPRPSALERSTLDDTLTACISRRLAVQVIRRMRSDKVEVEDDEVSRSPHFSAVARRKSFSPLEA